MTEDPESLHKLDPTSRFTGRADDYDRHRPTYPPEAIDALLEGLGEPSRLIAIDAGAGTGISARLLAARGLRVIGVEPNESMRHTGRTRSPDGVAWLGASAEATGLRSSGVDLVLCAQSFHWFEPSAALAEFHRILAPAGRVALMWNDRREEDPFTAAYTALLRVASRNHPALDRPDPSLWLRESRFVTGVRTLAFDHSQEHDLPGLIGRAMSASYAPREGAAHEALIDGLGGIHARFADDHGFVRIAYVTRLTLGERADGPGRLPGRSG